MVFQVSFSLITLFKAALIKILWHSDNLRGNPELDNYLAKLGTCKVEQLKKEQTRLADETKRILEQTQELAISNYKTFITTAENSRSIFHEFQKAEEQVDTLIGKLPTFSDKCEQFLKDSAELTEQRRVNSTTLHKNAQLLEILELPQLMERCIREGRYEEALELASYVQRLGQHQGHLIPVVHVSSRLELIHLFWLIRFAIPEHCAFRGGIVAYDACAAGSTVTYGSAAAQVPPDCWLSASHASFWG